MWLDCIYASIGAKYAEVFGSRGQLLKIRRIIITSWFHTCIIGIRIFMTSWWWMAVEAAPIQSFFLRPQPTLESPLLLPSRDAFTASPAAEFRLLRHDAGQLFPSTGGVVQHLSQPAKDFIIQISNTLIPPFHLRMWCLQHKQLNTLLNCTIAGFITSKKYSFGFPCELD